MLQSVIQPLPDISPNSALRRLTIESNTLIHTLIRSALHDEGVDASWVTSIKRALADFGECIVTGEWLPGLRSARMGQNSARVPVEKAARARARKERERLNESKLAKAKTSDKFEPKGGESKANQPNIQSKDELQNLAIRDIRTLVSSPYTPIPTLSPKHLLITTSFKPTEILDKETDFDLIPSSKRCAFIPDVYCFPLFDDVHEKPGEGGIIICGLDTWNLDWNVKPRIVGGNFVFHNLTSATVQESLAAVLRLSIYTYISLILEQDLLANSQLTLQFPPTLPTPISITPSPSAGPTSPTLSPTKRKTRVSKASAGIWSFLSKKTEGIFHRSISNNEEVDGLSPRISSLDLGSESSLSKSLQCAGDVTDSMSNTVEGSRAEDDRYPGPFTAAVRRIRDQRTILSTSPGIEFLPPALLGRLATQEQKRLASPSESSSLASSTETDPNSTLRAASAASAATNLSGMRLTGVEKAELGSVIGWEGREARGRGMTGVRGFVRHQGLTVLYGERVPPNMPCGRPQWVTFRYWARSREADTETDRALGEVVEYTCQMAKEPCDIDGCDKPRGQHMLNWTCSGVQVCGTVKEDPEGDADSDDVSMWQSCSVCSKSTGRARMNDGTYLYSFAKFLELLLWSPMLASLSLCEHMKVPPTESRFRILRHFARGGLVLTFSLASIQGELFEIRVPKLQVVSGSLPKEEKQLEDARRRRESDEERQVLLAEVDAWWKIFTTRLDRLDGFLQQEVAANLEGKNLPPLPLSDDDDLEEESSRSWWPEGIHTPSPKRPLGNRSTPVPTRPVSRSITPRPKVDKPAAAPYPPGPPVSVHQSRQLLMQLRSSFQETHDSVRKRTVENTQLSLNDIRRAFRSTSRGACKRLAAWEKKHAPGAPAGGGDLEPEWWKGTCHAVPGGRVVVRENEWGSVIAFTLSSVDYQRELASLGSTPFQQQSTPTTNISDTLASPPVVITKTTHSVISTPDPDDSEATSLWEEAEPCTTAIARREHPREASSLLSLRDVLRHKKSLDDSSLGSRFSSPISRGIVPPSAWSQPQVQVNLQSADGQVSQFPEAAEVVERVLGAQYPAYHQAEMTITSEDDMPTPTPSSFVEKNIRSGTSASIISFVRLEGHEQHEGLEHASSTDTSSPPAASHESEPSSATSGSSFSSALSNAVRYFLSNGSPTPSRSSSPTPAVAPHHGLLALEATPIDDRPHIKYDWTIGKRLKFSCTVYYAKQFDALRKRCGIDDIILKSLERTENWTAVGGKSKANFWKSSDDRFIIKTLVNAWNVADLQVLFDLGPMYFRYMDSTANRPSVLAKLMGFYTVEIKNLEAGTVQAKADLVVMENLFYNQKVSKTFDLKGIHSRRVKPNGDSGHRTLFDGEWIDGQQQAPLLLQPYSKLVLQEAIKADADFLARSNIMDYSLLLGIDEDRHEIACGLVDTIGSYTFAKTLEYKAKQNLNSGKNKEVTVMPPVEYQNRFVNAIEGYFLACPDKWTKPPHYVDRTRPDDLPSVL